MIVEELKLHNKSPFINMYEKQHNDAQLFFDYAYQSDDSYKNRLVELRKRNYTREALAQHLKSFNSHYQCSKMTIENIEKLLDPDSVTVIGGQQAGILTGPLYTIHKIISIIKLAKEKEEQLGIPVIPIFWIAGEDHDFDEINHIFNVSHKAEVIKHKAKQKNESKKTASDLLIDHDVVRRFLTDVFLDFKETGETKTLQETLEQLLNDSETYVDLFSYIIHLLFKESGIVLVNSHHSDLRQLEVPFFRELIRQNDSLHQAFLQQANLYSQKGFGDPIEKTTNNAHLFFNTAEGSRLLLMNNYDGTFSDRQNQYVFTEDELNFFAENEPDRFSNNVVTRPLMQEFLFPVLAFVGGPGEIAYWATLKETFHLFGFKVPPVVPRLSMTLVDPNVSKWLKELGLSIPFVFEEGAIGVGERCIYEQDKQAIQTTLSQVLTDVEVAHEPLVKLMKKYDRGLNMLAEKNLSKIQWEISFFAKKIEQSLREQCEHQFLKYQIIDAILRPNGHPQERSLNIVRYLNEYGLDFVERLLDLPLSINDEHKVIFI